MTLDPLIQFLLDCAKVFQCWIVVDEDEEAIILRNGVFKKHCQAGFYWKLPLYIDRERVVKMTPDTHNLSSQGLTTKDGQTITVAVIVEFKIKDARKALLEVQDRDGVIRDSALAECCRLVQCNDWSTVRSIEFAEQLTKDARKKAFRYGVEIMSVRFTDCTTTFSHTQTTIGS